MTERPLTQIEQIEQERDEALALLDEITSGWLRAFQLEYDPQSLADDEPVILAGPDGETALTFGPLRRAALLVKRRNAIPWSPPRA